ncbi:hypothetical protein OROMI_020620 [Orobanche minor]
MLILVTYLSDVPTEIPAGLDPSYHFYGNIYAIMIWACEAIPSLSSKCGIMLGASFIQRPYCTRWKLKKLGHIDFTTFFDDEGMARDVPDGYPPVIPTEILVTPTEIAPRIRPSSSTVDLSPIPLEYSSTTIRADTYHSPRLQYRSYRPHSPFSTTVVRKRKDLDEEAYSRWLDSDESATCINVWNDSKRKGGPLGIDDEDLDFLVIHIHGLRPFWGDHRPWWELREEGIIIMHNSLAQEEDAYLKLRSQQSLGISYLIPTILQCSGFYERRLDITPVHQFRVAIAKKDLCYVQDDSISCGALSIWTLQSVVQHSFSHGKTEMDIYAFRGCMARAIWRFSDDADTVVCDPTSLFIRFDDRDY